MVAQVKTGRESPSQAASPPCVKTMRPKLFRRASLTSWGKDNLKMTRAAADVNLKELMLTVQQQKFEDRDRAAQREMSCTASYEQQSSLRHRDARRARWLSQSGERRDFLLDWEREGRGKWNTNQVALCRYEQRLLNYELAVRQCAAAKKRISRARHAREEADGIRWFEKNLDRQGLDQQTCVGSCGVGTGSQTLLPERETRATYRSRILKAVLDQHFVPDKNAEFMTELRYKCSAGRRGRQECEHRRLKTDVDRRNAKLQADAQRATREHLLSMLLRGRERRNVASAYCAGKHAREEEVRSRRRLIDHACADQMAAFETVFNDRASRTRDRFAELAAERQAQRHVLQETSRTKADERRSRLEAMSREAVSKLADLAIVASELRANQGDRPLSPSSWAHLKRWFCSRQPFFRETAAPDSVEESHSLPLEAQARLAILNLERCEGCWRPAGAARAETCPPPSPLLEALATASEVVKTNGRDSREARSVGLEDNDAVRVEGFFSIRLVLLSERSDLRDVCAELEAWTDLYACSIDDALECALHVGDAVNAANGHDGKEEKGSASSRRPSLTGKGGGELVHSATETGATTAAKAATGEGKEESEFTPFHPDASQENIDAFKKAAATYQALRAHPKKGAAPIPLEIRTDLLVKHLSCRAPRGRGWILVNYPRTVLESKMLENALSGYTDDDVVAELGKATKSTKRKGSTVREQPRSTTTSAVDAVVDLIRSSAGRLCLDNNERRQEGSSASRAEAVEGVENDSSSEERAARAEWWNGFEGGQLWCDVPDEDNRERVLETLFLLVKAAQDRKAAVNRWRQDRSSRYQVASARAADQLAEGGDTGGDTSRDLRASADAEDVTSADLPSPLATPITAALDHLRHRRRTAMSHATRIRVEALCGERELDVDGIRQVLARTQMALIGEAGGSSEVQDRTVSNLSSVKAAVRTLEAASTASSVLAWAANTEFLFASKRRAFDDRWIAICVRLEDHMAKYLARLDDQAEAASQARGKRNCQNSHTSSSHEETPSVWDALDAFAVETGNVADDRHKSAETLKRSMDNEAAVLTNDWIEDIATAAATLCGAEREHYLEALANLYDLDTLFGLDIDQPPRWANVAGHLRRALDAVAEEFVAVSEARDLGKGGEMIQAEIRFAVEENRAGDCALDDDHHQMPENRNEDDASGIASLVREPPDQRGAGVPPGSGSLPTLPTLPSRERHDESKKWSRSVGMATQLCRHIFVCRLRAVVARLAAAITRCEAGVASSLATCARLNRRRLHLEHERVSVTISRVRHALRDNRQDAIEDMLRHGVPLCMNDDETFAADPRVALPWGTSGLSIAHVASLASFLQDRWCELCLGRSDGTQPAAALAGAVRAWSELMTREKVKWEELPRAWAGDTGEYINTVCGALIRGVGKERAPWRRLIHCLLLGHVADLPTLDDLRNMRHALDLRASSSAMPSGKDPRVRRNSPDVGAEANTTDDASLLDALLPTTKQIEPSELARTRLWFEAEAGDQHEDDNDTAIHHEASAAVKEVYSAVWADEDGMLDWLDLLLTFCAMPADVSAHGEQRSTDGIPFSPGLFRAFVLLAEPNVSPLASKRGAANVGTNATPASVVANNAGDTSQRVERDATDSHGYGQTPRVEVDGNPLITIPHLRAVLEHEGSLSQADVLGVCDAVLRTAGQHQYGTASPHVLHTDAGKGYRREEDTDPSCDVTTNEAASDILGEHGAPIPSHASNGSGFDDPDAVPVVSGMKAVQPAEDGDGTGDVSGRTAAGDERFMGTLVSFSQVCDCDIVRAWIRRGAYTLPTFECTSGRGTLSREK